MAYEGSQQGAGWNKPSVGRWGISALPQGWMFVQDFGARQMSDDASAIVASIALSQDPLPREATLADYIEKQRDLIVAKFPEAKLAGPQAAAFAGADEAHMLLIRHAAKDGADILQVQHYVVVADWVGIVTLTTPEQMLRAVRPDHELFIRGLQVLPPQAQPALSN